MMTAGGLMKKLCRSSLIALVLGLAVFGLAAASYTGPDRTVTTTTWERQYCNYRATVISPPGTCWLTLYYSPGSCPSSASVAGYFNNAQTACGTAWPGTCGSGLSCTIVLLTGSTQSCSSGETGCTQTTGSITYPPATVSGSSVCAVPGENGWCRGGASLDLSGSEPLSGYTITAIEGDSGLLCSGPACTWTFPEGATDLDFWALSSWGDTSLRSSAAMQVDSLAPVLLLSIPPVDGSNGWFVSGPVSASASASDASSGVNGVSINGGSSTFTASTDGIYLLNVIATDLAGNTASSRETIALDTAPPSLSVSVPQADGSNGWYLSPQVLTASGVDITSGLAALLTRLDGGDWTSASSVNIPEGVHVVEIQARDLAGNQASARYPLSVDTTPPTLTLTLPVPQGNAGWYTGGFQFSGVGDDTISGVQGVAYSLDGAATWQASPPDLVEGRYTVHTRVTDRAGNNTTRTDTVNIDLTPPQSVFTIPAEGSQTVIQGSLAMTGQTLDLTSGPANAEISMDGGTTWQPLVLVGGTWAHTWDSSSVPNGTYLIWVRAQDLAGNQEHTAQITVVVANAGPEVSISETWWLWERAEIHIQGSLLPVTGAQLTISDGQGHTRTYRFDASDLPHALQWDGGWDDGRFAPPGDYSVVVSAWDIFGNTGQDSGTVQVPLPPATPTGEPPAVPAAATELPSPAVVAPAPTIVPRVLPPTPPPAIRPVTLPRSPAPPTLDPLHLWPVIGLVGLLAAFASSSWADERPSALHRLAVVLTNAARTSDEPRP
jgi:hypothetical protein